MIIFDKCLSNHQVFIAVAKHTYNVNAKTSKVQSVEETTKEWKGGQRLPAAET